MKTSSILNVFFLPNIVKTQGNLFKKSIRLSFTENQDVKGQTLIFE